MTLPYPDRDAKNLLCGMTSAAIIISSPSGGTSGVNLKEFRRRQGTKPLTFASPEELQAILA